MTIKDALNRGFNLLSVSIVGLAGFAFLPEAFLENDIHDKLDDSLLFLLGLYAIGWYVRGSNRFSRSVQPIAFVTLALVVKLAAVIVEFGDPESVGDDVGGFILFAIATGLIIYQYRKAGEMVSAGK